MKYFSLLIMAVCALSLKASSEPVTDLTRLLEADLNDALLKARLMSFKEALSFVYPRHAQVRLSLDLDNNDTVSYQKL